MREMLRSDHATYTYFEESCILPPKDIFAIHNVSKKEISTMQLIFTSCLIKRCRVISCKLPGWYHPYLNNLSTCAYLNQLCHLPLRFDHAVHMMVTTSFRPCCTDDGKY